MGNIHYSEVRCYSIVTKKKTNFLAFMTQKNIEEKILNKRKSGDFDKKFLDILSKSNTDEEESSKTAERLIEEVNRRYENEKD